MDGSNRGEMYFDHKLKVSQQYDSATKAAATVGCVNRTIILKIKNSVILCCFILRYYPYVSLEPSYKDDISKLEQT